MRDTRRVIGGVGFVLGDSLNMLGRGQWGPIGRYEILHDLDYWKWMEQSFGLIMGLGAGAVFLVLLRPRVSTPVELLAHRRYWLADRAGCGGAAGIGAG